MKIYISAPVKHRPELEVFFDALKKLGERGHTIIDVYDEEDLLDTEDVNLIATKYKEMERAIREADMVIVESTYPGRRIGFEIARAIDEKKAVIALYNDKLTDRTPGLLVGAKSKHFNYHPYNKDNLMDVLNDAIEEAKKNLDTKFILIISPEIDKYLDWAASERRMHKAQIVRNAVEKEIEKDKEYNDFLKSNNLV